ncbi:MAG TPA: single-stranded-DNA-specific exonuclease RecJ [Anaerolineae bacterium]|nr:single-stranded-DNA-specific exonuclease RecJ [Anaerolineae bacterium]
MLSDNPPPASTEPRAEPVSRLKKRWEIAPRAPAGHFALLPDLPPLLVQVLYNRGLKEPGPIAEFLGDDAPPADPFLLKGMGDAVVRLRRAIVQNEPIAVYGDYDVDGVTATALLTQALRGWGANVTPYIPDRFEEGYGLNAGALGKLSAQGAQVVVTVDCGARALDEVAHANRLGLDVIVTDHHEPEGDRLPAARALINPKQPGCPYPDKHLAGVGLAFRLAQALAWELARDGSSLPFPIDDLLDLVALGTVADLAPLVGENRDMVRRGLRLMNAGSRPGVVALCNVAGQQPGELDAGSIGYSLGPRLNAAGRVEHARAAYQLLVSPSVEQAAQFAYQLNEQNRERQRLTAEMVDAAAAQALAGDPEAPILFAASAGFSPGVIGLAASRLVEVYHRPAIVMSVGEGEARGSARSIPQFHITHALDECKDLLVKHGGHAAAAGFSVALDCIDELKARLTSIAAARQAEGDWSPVLKADALVRLSTLTYEMVRHLARLEPYGMQNPQPVFVSRDIRVRGVRALKDGAHLKLTLLDENGRNWDAIAFRMGDRLNYVTDTIDVVYTVELNTWNGEQRLQLNIKDLQPGQA